MKTREVIFISILMFFVCSASLYWYDYFNKSRLHSIENEMRKKWEKDTTKWQKDVTDIINGVRKSHQEVLGVLNTNFAAGILVVPKQEKKK